MFKAHSFLRFLSLALPLLLMAESAFAWVGVGPDASCEVRTIQAAIDRIITRESHGDFNDPLIVIAGGNFNEALRINAGGSVLTIVGGYDSGCHGPVAGNTTTISAANRPGSVLTVNGGIALSLNSLNITGADTLGNGGGIDFDGTGTLDVTQVAIFGNQAAKRRAHSLGFRRPFALTPQYGFAVAHAQPHQTGSTIFSVGYAGRLVPMN